MFKRLSKNKRGLSVAISSVIMVAAVITVGLSVVAWTTGTFARQEMETSQFFSDRSQAIRENFVLEDVWFAPSHVYVTVRNVGTVNMTVTAINFNGTNHLSAALNIVNGTSTVIDTNWNWGASTQYYYIVVASARGQQIRQYYSTTG